MLETTAALKRERKRARVHSANEVADRVGLIEGNPKSQPSGSAISRNVPTLSLFVKSSSDGGSGWRSKGLTALS